MTNRSSARRLAPLLAIWLLGLGGCLGTGTPPTHFYILDAAASAGKTAASTLAVAVEPVELPKYLERPQIVSRGAGNRLEIASFQQWGGGLSGNIARVVTENLSRLLASDRVYALPTRGMTRPDYQVALAMNRFEADAEGRVVLDARWRISRPRGGRAVAAMEHTSWQGEPLPPEDYNAIAAAMSQALAHLSQQVAGRITALEKGR